MLTFNSNSAQLFANPSLLSPVFGTRLRKILRVLLLEPSIFSEKLDSGTTTYYTHLSIIYQENGSQMADRRLALVHSQFFLTVFVSLLFLYVAVCLSNRLILFFVKYWLIFALHSWNKNKKRICRQNWLTPPHPLHPFPLC